MLACFRVINEYERAVVFRLGRSSSENEKGPGLFFYIPCIDSITVIDLRTVTFDVPPQVSANYYSYGFKLCCKIFLFPRKFLPRIQ